MNPFKSFTLTWWQGSLLKLSMLALGLVLGATWPQLFIMWTVLLLVLFFVPALYLSYVWWKQ